MRRAAARRIAGHRATLPGRPPHWYGGSPSIQSVLIGRTSELAALQEALADVRRRRSGACVAITGALGLGKSRMLAELAARADVVFSGRGSEFETGVPYGPVIDALDDHLRAQGRALDDVLGATLDAERFEAHRAVRVLLEDLAPAVLALDDLHWADAATIELVCHLLRHPPAAPVLMAIAYRPVTGVLAAAVQRACRDGTCRRLELHPSAPTRRGRWFQMSGSS